jgi:hypothetical protein
MNILYKKVPANRSVPSYLENRDNLAQDLEPVGNGTINVAHNFPWTFTPGNPANQSTQARKETPVIILQEFYQKQSALQQQLKPYDAGDIANPYNAGNIATGSVVDTLLAIASVPLKAETDKIYEGIFDATDDNFSKFTYIFPHFSQVNFTINNTWEKKDLLDTIVEYQQKLSGPLGAGVGRGITSLAQRGLKHEANKGSATSPIGSILADLPNMVRQANMLKLQNSNPTVGLLDPPHIFQSSAPRQIQISFYLYNTHSTSSNKEDVQQTIIKNWELCYMLSYQNSVNKKNFFTGLGPVFYRVVIPGVHFSKASVISNLTISNFGNVRRLRLPIDGGPETDVNVPDAYKVDISLTDVFMPSKNLYAAVNDINAERVVSAAE